MAYIEGGAVLGGYVAVLAGVALRDAARRGYFDAVPPRARAELLDVIADIERAGRAWKVRVQTGNPETVPAEIGPSSALNSEQAAQLLELTPRRVRQLAETLGGRRARGRWVFDRDAVTTEAARRKGA